MRVYNVEFFNRSMQYVGGTVTDSIAYEYDYLSVSVNSLTIVKVDGVSIGDYIRIAGAPVTLCGIVEGIELSKESKLVSISYSPLTSVLDVDCLFDTNLQGGVNTLEATLADIISSLYKANPDTLQNIPGLTVTTTSSTLNWGFNLKSTHEGMHKCIINLWASVISKALLKYGVLVSMDLDLAEKKVRCVIGKIVSSQRFIEADLPNIIEKNLIIDAVSGSANKLVVYNAGDYSATMTYYLHSDGTYDKTNADRVLPVNLALKDVQVEEGSSFASAADSVAGEVLGGAMLDNLIELTVLPGDRLVLPEALAIGQSVKIYSNGVAYTSILTGYQLTDRFKLIFGNIRRDLTKMIGGR